MPCSTAARFSAKLLVDQLQLAPDAESHLVAAQLHKWCPALPANPTFNGVAASAQAQALPTFVRNALGMLGQSQRKPQPGGFPLPPPAATGRGGAAWKTCSKLAAAATSPASHQLSSLEQSGRTADGSLLTTWQLEIPCAAPTTSPLQVKFQREDPPEQKGLKTNEHREQKIQLWRARLAFDLAAGPAACAGTIAARQPVGSVMGATQRHR